MTVWNGILLGCSAAGYAASTGVFFAEIAAKTAHPGVRASRESATGRVGLEPIGGGLGARAFLLLGALFHTSYVVVASFIEGACPVGSLQFVLSAVAIVAAFVFVLLGRSPRVMGLADNLDALGIVVAPLGLALLLASFFLDKPEMSHSLGTGLLATHVLMNVVGLALFVLAGGAAVLYLVQDARLKNKKVRSLGGLPSIDALDRAVHRFLVLGFPPVTLGLISGTFFAYQLQSGTEAEVLRMVFGYAAWGVVAVVLVLRVAFGFRGRRSAYGTLLGLVFAMVVLALYAARTPVSVGSVGGDASRGALASRGAPPTSWGLR